MPPEGFIDFVIHNMGLKVMHVMLDSALFIGGWISGMAETSDGISFL